MGDRHGRNTQKSARRLMRAVKKQLNVAPGWLLASVDGLNRPTMDV
jgi:hypothetical protein